MPQGSSRLKQFTFTIANGASLSNEVDLAGDGNWLPVAIFGDPTAWTAAAITALGRYTPAQTAQVINDTAGEWTIPSAQVASGKMVMIDLLADLWVRYLTLRSGTSGSPVAQGGARTLILICRSVGS